MDFNTSCKRGHSEPAMRTWRHMRSHACVCHPIQLPHHEAPVAWGNPVRVVCVLCMTIPWTEGWVLDTYTISYTLLLTGASSPVH